jgi:hypothetical protein
MYRGSKLILRQIFTPKFPPSYLTQMTHPANVIPAHFITHIIHLSYIKIYLSEHFTGSVIYINITLKL